MISGRKGNISHLNVDLEPEERESLDKNQIQLFQNGVHVLRLPAEYALKKSPVVPLL